jgi:hypothetical protein
MGTRRTTQTLVQVEYTPEVYQRVTQLLVMVEYRPGQEPEPEEPESPIGRKYGPAAQMM